MFFLLYKSTDYGVFDDFPKISTTFRRLPKIFQNCFEGKTNVLEHFPRISENSQRFPKIAEDGGTNWICFLTDRYNAGVLDNPQRERWTKNTHTYI